MTRARVAAAVTVLALALPGVAHSHGRTVSHSTWRADGARVSVHLEIARRDQTALTDPSAQAVSRQLTLRVGDAPCAVEAGSASTLSPSPRWRAYEWELSCPAGPGETVLRSELLFDALSGHTHIARVELGDRAGAEVVLSATQREARWSGAGPRVSGPAQLVDMIAIGARHVLGGLDHLVFLLVLVVVARRLREVALVVTGFTVGHSVTLGLSALGLASPEPAAVEALIGLSIAVVAIENVWLDGRARGWAPYVAVLGLVVAAVVGGHVPRLALIGCALFAACYFALSARAGQDPRMRATVALLFGTVHGFGFAAALPGVDAVSVWALVGFNAGVELGQLLVLAAVWPALILARRAGAQRAVLHVGSALAFVAGLSWFLARGF